MDQYVIKAIIRAIQIPLIDKKIRTRDMMFKSEKVSYKVGPSATTFYFALAKVNDLQKALKLSDSIAMSVSRAMNLPRGKSLNVRITAQGGYLSIGVARLDRWLPCWQDIQDKISNHIFIGFDEFNEPVYLDLFNETSPGLFAVGSSGSGKTNLIRLILNQLREKGVKYYLVDLKGGKDWRYDLAHFAEDFAFEDEKAESITAKVFSIMQERNRTNADHEPLVFVFDEVTEADDAHQKTLGRLSKLCRSANIRLIFGAQRIGEDLNQEIKGNLKRRVVGWVSGVDAFNATGVRASGAQSLEMKGDMLVCHPHGVTRVQVPRANQADLGFNLDDVEKPKTPIINVKPSPKQESKKILKDDKAYLVDVLPLEKRSYFFKWVKPAIEALNQSLVENNAKEIEPEILFFSAHGALNRGKPVTVNMIKEELKRIGVTGTPARKAQKIRWFGGAVVGDEKSLKQLKKMLSVA